MEKQYKVGEFAKNLGVSVGFLKHHERYGTLTPLISPSGYRYYEYSQAMQAIQCLRLQNLGFTSKEVAYILTHSAEIDLNSMIKEKKEELQRKMEFYEETLQYIQRRIQSSNVGREEETNLETWSVYQPESFYYLENSRERQFIEDPKIQDLAAQFVEYVPMADVVSRVTLADCSLPPKISSWGMGLTLRKAAVKQLNISFADQLPLITLGKCLVYQYDGTRTIKRGYEHLNTMLKRPLDICRKHHFAITGEVYQFNTFCSTYGTTSYVREIILIPILD